MPPFPAATSSQELAYPYAVPRVERALVHSLDEGEMCSKNLRMNYGDPPRVSIRQAPLPKCHFDVLLTMGSVPSLLACGRLQEASM